MSFTDGNCKGICRRTQGGSTMERRIACHRGQLVEGPMRGGIGLQPFNGQQALQGLHALHALLPFSIKPLPGGFMTAIPAR